MGFQVIRTPLVHGNGRRRIVAGYDGINGQIGRDFTSRLAQKEADSRKDIRHIAAVGGGNFILVDVAGRSVVEFSGRFI
jgi:hypothetical protein